MIEGPDIKKAFLRISSHLHHTPVYTSKYFDTKYGASFFFKCENFQKTGSFKARGALNSVWQLSSEEKQRGVATHSSGNHGQALAWAARQSLIKAYIIMPDNAPWVKVEAVRSYGAEVIFCESNLKAREEKLEEVSAKTGAVYIPPYNYYHTIEGQATAALELLHEVPPLDYLLTPVGGGGLLSGSALSTHYFSTLTKVIGCEPADADDAWQSFHQKKLVEQVAPRTIADGLRTSLGDITFGFIIQHVHDIWRASEDAIITSMKEVWERMKLVIEPSAALPLACIRENPSFFKGQRVGIILSGGNVDLGELPF